MSKKYQDIPAESPMMADEPMADYELRRTSPAKPTATMTVSGHIPANTISVDEYFDELLGLVHYDYAHL